MGDVRMLPPSETGSQPAGFAGSLTSQSARPDSNRLYVLPRHVCNREHFALVREAGLVTPAKAGV
jgi:hypothetical protein